MYRNINSHFSEVPRADIRRSKFRRPSSIKLSGNVGEIIPFFCDEVLPADTFQMKTSLVARLQTLVAPIMDNLYLDTYYFFCPSRILWEHFKEFHGENTQSKWIPPVEYTIPQIEAPSGGWNVGTIADYLGIPTGVDNISVNALPFRAYAKICNEWFRDQNNTDYLDIPFGDSTVTGVNTDTFVTDVAKGGKPFKAAKYHDYFTSCLPYPQKGNDVDIPIGTVNVSGSSTVYGTGRNIPFTTEPNNALFGPSNFGYTYSDGNNVVLGFSGADNGTSMGDASTISGNLAIGVPTKNQVEALNVPNPRTFTGLEAYFDDSQVSINAGTIGDLRLAFATQRLLELDARGGSRYREILLNHFGVVSPDARQQVPEYLGGSHIPVQINQVVQTSGEVGNTPQGNVAAYSVTSDVSGNFIKSFTEHGYVIGVCVMRYDHTYQQGLEKMWTRRKRTDFFYPEYSNIGEMPVFNREIYCQGTSDDDEVFGYNEAWAEYRYKPSRVAGEMRSTYATSLDVWHLGDEYTSLPVLQSDWIFEDKNNLDRCLQVTSSVSNQFFADFYLDLECTRPMPMFSIPGLKTL